MDQVVGYVKAKGTKLLNGNDEEIRLRGVGLGGWLLPEGYMWNFPEQGDRPWKMEKYIESCVGKNAAVLFWQHYRRDFISESDIQKIKSEGFNSIRLPFNARLLVDGDGYNETELFFIDRVIDWCEQHQLYVILDMHGVLGGQTGTNIDDSKDDQPDFFKDRKYQSATIKLWQFLAERYKDRWIVAGYDLMNEPLPEWFSSYNDQVMPIYKEIIAAIREVDKVHMIVLEGVHWSTDWSIFDEILDSNVLYQFHKYWNNPDQKSIKEYLDFRETNQVPIFMGEGGENNREWYVGAFSMFEDLDISWNFWTYKKMDNDNSLYSITKPKDWDVLIKNLKNNQPLNSKVAQHILDGFIHNIKFENCHYYKDVADALFSRAPITLPAIFYSNLGKDIGYHMTKAHKSTIDFRETDDTHIEFLYGENKKINFANGAGQKWKDSDRTVVRLLKDEWLNYTVLIPSDGSYTIDLSMKPITTSHIELMIDGQSREVIGISGQGVGNYSLGEKVTLSEGNHTIRIKSIRGSTLIEHIRISR